MSRIVQSANQRRTLNGRAFRDPSIVGHRALEVNCRNQAFSLIDPVIRVLSAMAIFQQSSEYSDRGAECEEVCSTSVPRLRLESGAFSFCNESATRVAELRAFPAIFRARRLALLYNPRLSCHVPGALFNW